MLAALATSVLVECERRQALRRATFGLPATDE
jgi:hypothetical protein